MRRKIEKFLAKKREIDESEVQPEPDGRFDLEGDFEGVLASIRGKDGMVSDTKTPRDHSDKKNDGKLSYGNPYYPYPAYGMHPMQYARMSGPPSMPGMPRSNNDKENHGRTYPSPWQTEQPKRKPAPASPRTNMSKTPISMGKALGFPLACLSSARKSMFDESPRSLHLGSSPDGMSLQGMTPPMSNLKDTFATPLPCDSLPNLSTEEAYALNKTLFSDEPMTPFPKTPVVTKMTVPAMQFYLGSDSSIGTEVSSMRISNRVSISPICKDAGNPNFFEDEEELTNSFQSLGEGLSTANETKFDEEDSDTERMPPPTAPRIRNAPKISSSISKLHQLVSSESRTPTNVTQDDYTDDGEIRDMADPSPFGSARMMKDMATPSTAASSQQSSFWSAQLGLSPVPLSPFPSPAGAPLSDNFEYSVGTYRIPIFLMLIVASTLHSRFIIFFLTDRPRTVKSSPPGKTGASPSPKRRRTADPTVQ
jgi:hypothetical protein